MDFIISLFNKVVAFIGSVEWKPRTAISESDKDKIKQMLKNDYYIVLTRRNNHLSTYFISVIEFFLRFKFAYWTHSVMNLEDTVTTDFDFRLMEATGSGVHYSDFDNVFDAQSAVLMKPKCMTIEKWTSVLDTARAQLGKPYDTLFDIADTSKLSCIELTRMILMSEPNYKEDFKNFEAMIVKYKNLSPQMLYDCEDFEVVFEVRT
jgi:hypothetical protein